jgi:hypothetical protein
MNPNRAAVVLAVLVVAGACASTPTGSVTTQTPITTATTAPRPTLPPTSSTVATDVTPGDLTVAAAGSDWTVPAAVCLGAADDAAAVAIAAEAEAEAVHRLVTDASSGWPTTTAAPDFGTAFAEGMALHGPKALALATIAGIDDEVVDYWVAIEALYGSAEFDPPTHIERRLDDWRAAAAAIVAAIDGACS